jgi:hypothetical protein
VDDTAAAAVHLPDYRAVNENYRLYENRKPYIIACLACVASLLVSARESKRLGTFTWVFEKGDTDQDNLRKCWTEEYPESQVPPIFRKKIDNCPDEDLSKPIRAFEAADLVAYENRRANGPTAK